MSGRLGHVRGRPEDCLLADRTRPVQVGGVDPAVGPAAERDSRVAPVGRFSACRTTRLLVISGLTPSASVSSMDGHAPHPQGRPARVLETCARQRARSASATPWSESSGSKVAGQSIISSRTSRSRQVSARDVTLDGASQRPAL